MGFWASPGQVSGTGEHAPVPGFKPPGMPVPGIHQAGPAERGHEKTSGGTGKNHQIGSTTGYTTSLSFFIS